MFQIPEDKLPDFAKDEERLNVLFAPIRNRSVNPKDWHSKITSWKTLLKLYCECNEIYSFSLTTISTIFVRHGRPPSCLKEVFEDMIKNKEIQPLSGFLKKIPDTWSSWASDVFVIRPVSWSYNKVKSVFSSLDIALENYVPLEIVKIQSEKLLDAIPDNCKNKLISLTDLLKLLGKDSGHVENIKLLLHYLTIQRKAGLIQLDGNKVIERDLDAFLIKFGSGTQLVEISDIDVGLYTLERNEKLISHHIETLEDEINQCIKEAKSHLSKNHRQMAKSCLIKKHKLEKSLEKKANALHNVQALIEQIKNTHSDAHVWEAYKNALNAFNTSYKETGLSEDAVEDTMLKLGEVLDIHDDIQTALSRPARDDDTSDLEEELAELMKEDEVNKPPDDDSGMSDDLEAHLKELNLNMPTPPKESPDASLEAVVQ